MRYFYCGCLGKVELTGAIRWLREVTVLLEGTTSIIKTECMLR